MISKTATKKDVFLNNIIEIFRAIEHAYILGVESFLIGVPEEVLGGFFRIAECFPRLFLLDG